MNDFKNVSKDNILQILEGRFNQHMFRHPNISFKDVLKRLTDKHINTLYQMEITGGEPDVVAMDPLTNMYTFMDCSKESPLGRRSLCYDDLALEKRRQNKPAGSAQTLAKKIGITLLNYDEYQYLQSLQEIDTKTSSWLETPDNIRSLGGALYGEHRYKTIFLGHNGADSYYGVRGFRGSLKV
ncbi:MAG: DUF4256 domain-containing protein [Acholeplasmataceae bacterium]|nr:DUF4256 domain-containing protein [Acholeplasmataceae bacterium]